MPQDHRPDNSSKMPKPDSYAALESVEMVLAMVVSAAVIIGAAIACVFIIYSTIFASWGELMLSAIALTVLVLMALASMGGMARLSERLRGCSNREF